MLFQVFNDFRMKNMANRFFCGHVLRVLLGLSVFGSVNHETYYPL